jgi:hypothetical protein
MSKNLIVYAIYGLVFVLVAPYAGCHILTSPATDDDIEAHNSDTLNSGQTRNRELAQTGSRTNQQEQAIKSREELAEIRELLNN